METREQLIAQASAALVVEEGLSMEAAKKRALRQLGMPPRTRLPGNDLLEAAIQDHIRLYCADTQPGELLALRKLALAWMDKLAPFNPLVGGSVWNGTATRLSDIHIQLFSDDPKEPAIWLLNEGFEHGVEEARGIQGFAVEVLGVPVPCPELAEYVTLHLWINDMRARRGALLPGSSNQAQRGSADALRQKMTMEAAERTEASPP